MILFYHGKPCLVIRMQHCGINGAGLPLRDNYIATMNAIDLRVRVPSIVSDRMGLG